MTQIDDSPLIIEELEVLMQEHEELDQIIDDPESQKNFDQLTLQRFKKRKLLIKDKIEHLKVFLYPDIIA
jgi:hypothetical protein